MRDHFGVCQSRTLVALAGCSIRRARFNRNETWEDGRKILTDRKTLLTPWNNDGVSARLVQVISDQVNRSFCTACAGTLVGRASGAGVAARSIFSSRSFGYRAA